MATDIEHEREYQQFTIKLEGDDAELAYTLPEEGVINFTHTYVPKSDRGNGLAVKLIERGLAFARDHKYKVEASCPVVAKYLKEHPEYQDFSEE